MYPDYSTAKKGVRCNLKYLVLNTSIPISLEVCAQN